MELSALYIEKTHSLSATFLTMLERAPEYEGSKEDHSGFKHPDVQLRLRIACLVLSPVREILTEGRITIPHTDIGAVAMYHSWSCRSDSYTWKEVVLNPAPERKATQKAVEFWSEIVSKSKKKKMWKMEQKGFP